MSRINITLPKIESLAQLHSFFVITYCLSFHTQLRESMRNVGYHVIHGHKDVCMTLEQNLLDPNFKHF